MAKQKKPDPAKKPETLKQTSKEFRLVSRDTEKMPVELSQAERDRCAVQLAELVEEKERLDEDKREVMREWRVKLRAKQEEIDDCAAGVIRGAKPTQFTIETRAVFKTRMIERVRTEDSKLIEKRPMTPEEEVLYLQTDIAERAQPAALLREPSTLVTNDDALADEPDATDGDTLPDDECDAIRVPHGWPRPWMERRWKVEGAALPLTGADIAQVHCSLSSGGSTLDELCAEGAPAAYLGRPHVSRALGLMLGRDLVVKGDEGKWFAKVEAPAEPTEAGRNDTLPEAADVSKKPRRRGAKDTGEKAINKALGQSEGMEASA